MAEFFVRDHATAAAASNKGADGDLATCTTWALRNRLQIQWHLRGVTARAVVLGQEEETSAAVNSFPARLAEVIRHPAFGKLSREEHSRLRLDDGRFTIPYTFWIVIIAGLPHAIAADSLEALVFAVQEALYEARR